MYRSILTAGIIISFAAAFYFYRQGQVISENRFGNRMYNDSPFVPEYAEDIISDNSAENMTLDACLWSFLYFMLQSFIFFYSIFQNQQKTKRGLGVGGIAITVLMLGWTVLMYISPGHISFDEVYFVWMGVAVLLAAFDLLMIRLSREIVRRNEEILDEL